MIAMILFLGSLAFLLILFGFCVGYYVKHEEKRENHVSVQETEPQEKEIEKGFTDSDTLGVLEKRIREIEGYQMVYNPYYGGIYTQ